MSRLQHFLQGFQAEPLHVRRFEQTVDHRKPLLNGGVCSGQLDGEQGCETLSLVLEFLTLRWRTLDDPDEILRASIKPWCVVGNRSQQSRKCPPPGTGLHGRSRLLQGEFDGGECSIRQHRRCVLEHLPFRIIEYPRVTQQAAGR